MIAALVMMVPWLGASEAWAGSFRATCYPSGFKIAVEERPGQPLVGLGMVIEGGSSVEEEAEIGVAHLLEHLWFRRPFGDYAHVTDLLADVGADSNAFTSVDETVFLTVAHRKHLVPLLALEAARLHGPTAGVDSASFEIERDVVRNEAQQRYAGTVNLSAAVFAKTLRPGHPYGRAIAGSEEQIASLTLERAGAYAERHYVPSRSSLYIAGAVTVGQVRDAVAEAFPREFLAASGDPDDIAPGGCPSSSPDYTTKARTSIMEIDGSVVTAEANVDVPVGVLAWPAPDGVKGAARAGVVADLLSYYLSDHDIDGDCGLWDAQQLNTVVCAVVLDRSSKAARRLDSLEKELARFWLDAADLGYREGKKMRLVARSRNRATTSQRKSDGAILSSRPDGHLAVRARMLHWVGYHHRPKEIDSTAASVVARKELGPVRKVIVSPDRGTTIPPSAWHGARDRAAVEGASRQAAAVDPAALAAHVENPLAGIERVDVEGGTTLWVLRRPGVGYTRFALVYPGTATFADPSTKWAAWLHTDDPSSGASRAAMWKLTSNQGGVSASTSSRAWRFDVYSGSYEASLSGLKAILPRVGTMTHPKVVAKYLEARRKGLAASLERPQTAAYMLRWKALAGGMPHPSYSSEGIKALGRLSPRDAAAFAEAVLEGGRRHVVAVLNEEGDTDEQIRLLKAALRSKGSAEEIDTSWTLPTRAATPRAIHVVPDETKQASVTLACHLNRSDDVVVDLLERSVQQELHERLRNEVGATYGVSASALDDWHGATLEVATELPPSLVGDGLSAIVARLELISRGNAPRLAGIKEQLAKETVLRWQSTRAMANLVESVLVQGGDPRQWDLAADLAAVSAQDLATVMAPCVGHEVVTITGPAEPVGAALREAGFDPVMH